MVPDATNGPAPCATTGAGTGIGNPFDKSAPAAPTAASPEAAPVPALDPFAQMVDLAPRPGADHSIPDPFAALFEPSPAPIQISGHSDLYVPVKPEPAANPASASTGTRRGTGQGYGYGDEIIWLPDPMEEIKKQRKRASLALAAESSAKRKLDAEGAREQDDYGYGDEHGVGAADDSGETPPPRKRGRPRKIKVEGEAMEPAVPKKRGRPRKIKVEDVEGAAGVEVLASSKTTRAARKRKGLPVDFREYSLSRSPSPTLSASGSGPSPSGSGSGFIDPRAASSTPAPPPIPHLTPSSNPYKSKTKGKAGRTGKVMSTSEALAEPDAPLATLAPQGYPMSFTVPYDEAYVYLYFRFCAERHAMWVKRTQGVPRAEQTDDECMRNTFVGNVFRELDPAGQRAKGLVVDQGEQTVEEKCFRAFLFTGFYLEETYQALVDGLGETPSWKNFNLERYEAVFYEYHIVQRKQIYYGGFQLVPPKSQFGVDMPSYSATLRMVMSMMDMGLPARLEACKYAVDASEAIQAIPTFGGFLSLCLLCFIQENDIIKFYLRNFATCGPGSRGFLQRIFGAHVINDKATEQAGLMWLYENQWRYWARLGVDPPHAHELGLRPGMRVLDIENALCWCHRYANDSAKYRSLADLPPPTYDPQADEAGPPAWCDEERHVASYSRPAYAGDYEEEKAKLPQVDKTWLNAQAPSSDIGTQANGTAAADNNAPNAHANGDAADAGEKTGEEDEEPQWELDKIVARTGNRSDRNGLFRVRWKGYPPEEDTWEREASLKKGSREALDEWYEWENGVFETINRIRREYPYKGPNWRVRPESAKGKAHLVKMGRHTRPGMRAGTRSNGVGAAALASALAPVETVEATAEKEGKAVLVPVKSDLVAEISQTQAPQAEQAVGVIEAR